VVTAASSVLVLTKSHAAPTTQAGGLKLAAVAAAGEARQQYSGEYGGHPDGPHAILLADSAKGQGIRWV
jgi:hypothetical protein